VQFFLAHPVVQKINRFGSNLCGIGLITVTDFSKASFCKIVKWTFVTLAVAQFLQALRAKIYENISMFVKLMYKTLILSFFPRRCIGLII